MIEISEHYWNAIRDACVDHIIDMVSVETERGPVALSASARKKIERLKPTLATFSETGDDSESLNWLGKYAPMRSPGTITLHLDNLGGLFWHALKQIVAKEQVTFDQMRDLAAATAYVTFLHEMFHHYCDVNRGTPNETLARLREEALAVAWSWYGLHHERATFPTLPDGIWQAFLDLRFDYRAPGYTEWSDYLHCHVFVKSVSDHLIIKTSLLAHLGNVRTCMDGLFSWKGWKGKSVHFQFVRNGATGELETKGRAIGRLGVLNRGSKVLTYVPTSVKRSDVDVSGSGKSSFAGIRRNVTGDLYFCNNNAVSLQNIHKNIGKLNGTLCLYGNPVRSNVLGLLVIEGLKRVVLYDQDDTNLTKVSEIVNKYLPNTQGKKGVLLCQRELLEAGLEEFAKL